MRRDTTGMALPLVLLLLLALTTFGHGALVLSQREVQASAAFRDLTRAERGAEVGLRLALSRPLDPFGDRPAWVAQLLLTGELSDGLTYSATRRWIDREFFVLQGKGGVKGWPGERTVAWVGWTLHPGARLSSFLAASEVGSRLRLDGASTFSTDGFLSAPEEWPMEVAEELRVRAKAIFPGGPLPGVARGVSGPGQTALLSADGSGVSFWDSTGIPGLGLLSGAELLRRSHPFGDEGASHAGGDGAGCPDSGDRPVFLGSSGSLSLSPGRICGLLVTGGDLRIGTGAVFRGWPL